MFRYYGFSLWLPELFNRFESYYQSYPNVSVTVCELIHNTQLANHNPILEEAFVLLANEATRECKPHIDERVFINSLTINAICLFGNIISGHLANRVSRQTMPGKCYVYNSELLLLILLLQNCFFKDLWFIPF